jgi:hypothetical protein
MTMQTRSKLLLAGGAAALLALGGLAGLAQADMQGGMGGGMGEGHGGGMMGRQLMERYDTDKDGKVTQQEIDKNRADWLAEADADKTGSLSLEEFKVLWLKARNEMMVREFQFFDRDGNGQVTIEEYQGPMSDMVAERDRNADGALSKDDRPAKGEGRRGRHGRGEHGMGQGMGEGMGQGHGKGMGQGHGKGMGQGHGMGQGQGMGQGMGPCMTGDDDAEAESPAETPPAEAPATP